MNRKSSVKVDSTQNEWNSSDGKVIVVLIIIHEALGSLLDPFYFLDGKVIVKKGSILMVR